MGEHLKVSAAHMSSDEEELQRQISEIPKAIEELQGSMRRLSECWEGAAWSAFQNQVADDIKYMAEVYGFLVDHLEKLDEAKTSYVQTERQVYDNVYAIKI